ncbi:MAG: hypothetical protein ABH822_01105 [Patescibacteria group bacterium]
MNNKGISLIETVIYLGLVVIIIPIAAALMFFSVDARVRGADANLVLVEGGRVAQIITRVIRNADDINFPSLGSASSTLSLTVDDSAKSPTIFQFNNGALTIKEGGGVEIALVSENITVSSVLFQNVSRSGTPGSIKAEFTLVSGPLSRNFYVSASLQ